MRYLPYVFGIFLLTPFVIWAGLSTVMPGPQSGITDAPLTTALLIVSLPLVVYHSMAGLAFVANSMSGRSGETAPVWGPARRISQAMAPLTLVLTIASAWWIVRTGEGAASVAGVALAGLAMAGVIAAAQSGRPMGHWLTRPAALLLMPPRQLGRLLLAVPFLGHMLREIAQDPHRAGPWVMLNAALALIAMVWLFGVGVLVVLAMLSIPAVFCGILMFCTE
ncbi:hypothetical protein L2D01_14030 [Hyphomonadaceae bacterium ML37]|nr:hypothetical protein L2D01_14030 [Hyphomonadaceae bacterium ML37]